MVYHEFGLAEDDEYDEVDDLVEDLVEDDLVDDEVDLEVEEREIRGLDVYLCIHM